MVESNVVRKKYKERFVFHFSWATAIIMQLYTWYQLWVPFYKGLHTAPSGLGDSRMLRPLATVLVFWIDLFLMLIFLPCWWFIFIFFRYLIFGGPSLKDKHIYRLLIMLVPMICWVIFICNRR
jgi:hypothetical protein